MRECTLQSTYINHLFWSIMTTCPVSSSILYGHPTLTHSRQLRQWGQVMLSQGNQTNTPRLWAKEIDRWFPMWQAGLTSNGWNHRLNMEFDLHSLFGLQIHICTHWLRPRNPPPPRIWAHIRGRYWSAIKIDDIFKWTPRWESGNIASIGRIMMLCIQR